MCLLVSIVYFAIFLYFHDVHFMTQVAPCLPSQQVWVRAWRVDGTGRNSAGKGGVRCHPQLLARPLNLTHKPGGPSAHRPLERLEELLSSRVSPPLLFIPKSCCTSLFPSHSYHAALPQSLLLARRSSLPPIIWPSHSVPDSAQPRTTSNEAGSMFSELKKICKLVIGAQCVP